MSLHYRTQGVILSKKDRGEADQIFTIFTKDFGKIEVLGKGIRKIVSKLRSSICDFYLSEIEFVQGKNYKILTDALLIEKFGEIRKVLLKLKIILKISRVLDVLVEKEEPDERIWELLIEILKRLKNSPILVLKLYLIYHYFFWNLISILGYKPQLYFCLFCQKKLKPERLYFSLQGGITCNLCSKNDKLKIPISAEEVKILRKILEKDWRILEKLKFKKRYLQSLEKIAKFYLKAIVEKNEESI